MLIQGRDDDQDPELSIKHFIQALSIWSSIINNENFDYEKIWRVDITCSNLELLSDFFALYDQV